MKIIVCGASGFVGRNLVPALIHAGHDITVLGRDARKLKKLFQHNIAFATWNDLTNLAPDAFDAAINLAGETISKLRWTETAKQEILKSRINATQAIVKWCLTSSTKKPHLYNASAIGIYGQQSTINHSLHRITEALQTVSQNTTFLGQVGKAWENAANAAIAHKHPVTFMRFGVVLKKSEGILKKLELPFSLGMGSRLGTGEQAFTWVHIDDLVQAIIFLIAHPDIQGGVNVCAPECVSQEFFATTFAKVLNRPLFLKIPASFIELMFGQMGKELLLNGQNVYPERLLKANFTFKFPTLRAALENEWKLPQKNN